VTEEYKATGKQLDVPPDARGVLIDEWQSRRMMPTAQELAAFLAKRGSAASKPKQKPAAKSGALPDNTEWL
jgi:hypothetical protein